MCRPTRRPPSWAVRRLEGEAFKKAQVQFNRKFSVAVEEEIKKKLEEFQGFLYQSSSGGSLPSKSSTDTPNGENGSIENLFAQFIGSKKRPPSVHDMGAIDMSKKQKKEARGEKIIPERKSRMATNVPAAEKLIWLDSIYDEEHNDYSNEDRQFLMRAKKAIHCYRNCCNRDTNAFLDLHGCVDKKGNRVFFLTKVKPCTSCNQS